MKKKIFGWKLSRETDTRLALFRSLAREFILREKINTTKSKALAVRPFLEKLVSKARENTLSSRRRVFALLGNDKEASNKLFSIASKFSRKSGFIRLIPLGVRKGDKSNMVKIEWSQDLKENKVKKSLNTKEVKEKIKKEKKD